MPKISVLMPSFNYARYLPLAIESVLAQSYSDLELVVIDDCSTDDSRKILMQYKERDNRVVPILHEVNRGLANARNSGLAASTGEFVALCDADDIWLPEKLATQMECFRAESQTGVVYSDSSIIDGDGNLTGQRFSSLIHRKGQITSGNLFDELCLRNFLCVPTVIMRREALEYAQGFDPALRSLEDWVCWTKISHKYLFSYIETSLAQYRVHGRSLSHNSKSMSFNRAEAIRILLNIYGDIPANIKSKMFYSLGVSYLELSDSQRAASTFIESIKANPREFRSWVRCCQAIAKSVFTFQDRHGETAA